MLFDLPASENTTLDYPQTKEYNKTDDTAITLIYSMSSKQQDNYLLKIHTVNNEKIAKTMIKY